MKLKELTIEWDQVDVWADTTAVREAVTGSQTLPVLPSASDWQVDVPLLRLQITVVDLNKSFGRQDLNNQTEVFFLYPSRGYAGDGKKVHGNYGGQGSKVGTPGQEKSPAILVNNCRNDNPSAYTGYICKAVLSGIPNSHYSKTSEPRLVYVVRIQSYYRPARLKITGNFDTSGVQNSGDVEMGFSNIQASITATGRIKDIFERLQKRIPCVQFMMSLNMDRFSRRCL